MSSPVQGAFASVEAVERVAALRWRLAGTSRVDGAPLELWVTTREPLAGPEGLIGATPAAVQMHRAAGPALVALLAPPRAPLALRAMWFVLLNALRIPGVAGWLARRRGG
jgi:hypothetical protein